MQKNLSALNISSFFLIFFQCVNDDEVDDDILIVKKFLAPVVSKENHLSALKIAFDSGKKILSQYGNRSGRRSIDIGICEVRSPQHHQLPPSVSLSHSMTIVFRCPHPFLHKYVLLPLCCLIVCPSDLAYLTNSLCACLFQFVRLSLYLSISLFIY